MFESKAKIEAWAECGDDYYYGQNGEKVDYEMAVHFYEKAMKKKHPRATYMLGLCYELGQAVEQDAEYAEILFEKAAGYGDKDAKKRLKSGKAPKAVDEDESEDDDTAYLQDTEVENAPDEAYKPDLLAGDTGELPDLTAALEKAEQEAKAQRTQEKLERIDAMLKSKSEQTSSGITAANQAPQTDAKVRRKQENLERIGNMLQNKSELGEMFAKGMAYLDEKKYYPAAGCLRKAAEAGNVEAMTALGTMLCGNKAGQDKDLWKQYKGTMGLVSEGRKWLKKAAEQGDAKAQSTLERQNVESAAAIEQQKRNQAEKKAKAEARKRQEEDRKYSSSRPGSNHWAGAAAATRAAEKAASEQRAKNNSKS